MAWLRCVGNSEKKLELLQQNVSSESELSVTVSASSSYSATYAPWKAFLSSSQRIGWIAGNSDIPIWYQVEFPVAKTLKLILYSSADTNRYQVPTSVRYSNDGVNYTDFNGYITKGRVNIADNKSAKYIRIYFDETFVIGHLPQLTDLKLYGY